MTMNVNKIKVNMEEYYSGLYNMPLPVFSRHINRKTICRVCLQDGDMPITSVANLYDMIETLHALGNIEIDNDDENPTYLCFVCYKFLKSAILFRQIAHRANETLRKPTMKASTEYLYDFDSLANYVDYEQKPIIKSPSKIKKPKKRFACKREPVTKDNKVQCPICKKILGKSYYYNIHLQLHNPNLPDKFMCDICGKPFKFKKTYDGHMARHETRYIFKCQLCPYAGRYKERLSMHMRVHNGELKYLCTQCPARYVTRGRLNDHIRLKHTEKQFKCSYCVKAFHDNLNLQRHIDASHLGLKNHECNLCGKTFGYRKKFLDHQRDIHKISVRPHVKRIIRKATMTNEGNQ